MSLQRYDRPSSQLDEAMEKSKYGGWVDADEAEAEVNRLENAIRKHRDYRGDDRCFQDDSELYAVLPEGDTRPLNETAVTIENCQKYIQCRQQGRQYVSPQRRIAELEDEVKDLRMTIRDIHRKEGE